MKGNYRPPQVYAEPPEVHATIVNLGAEAAEVHSTRPNLAAEAADESR